MLTLLFVGLAGFAASLIDGSMGMGYGVTTGTLLLAIGLSPAVASASVHLAKIGTGAVSGFAHGKMGNVDKPVFWRLVIPGGVGAFLGATVLSSVPANAARPWVSLLLLALGVLVFAKFLRSTQLKLRKGRPSRRLLIPLGAIGGFVDATGGGGWGPVTTPTLLATGRMAPGRVVGTVNAAEFVVAICASVGFFFGLGLNALDWRILVPLLVGGMLAAPLGAIVAKRVPMRIMGVAVGGVIILTNVFTLLRAIGASGSWQIGILIPLLIAYVVVLAGVVHQHRQSTAKVKDLADA